MSKLYVGWVLASLPQCLSINMMSRNLSFGVDDEMLQKVGASPCCFDETVIQNLAQAFSPYGQITDVRLFSGRVRDFESDLARSSSS